MALQGKEPVFSASRLFRLAEDFDSDAVAISYAETFLQLLPERIGRLLAAVCQGDTAVAMDTVLSLKVRSHMLGGLAMERSCRELQRCLRDGVPSAAVAAAECVARDGDALRLALEDFLAGFTRAGVTGAA